MKAPRMFDWGLVALTLLVIMYLVAPENTPVVLYKLSLISVAGVAGYFLDRSIFRYARPHQYLDFRLRPGAAGRPFPAPYEGSGLVFAACMIRRAIIIGCAMLGVTMGL